MAADISTEIQRTHDHLQTLQLQIMGGVQTFDDREIAQIIEKLHKDGNFLTRHLVKMNELKEVVVPIDSKIKRDILELIFKILHSPDFAQALGGYQKELYPVLNKIESAVHKWTSKVEPVR